MYFSHLYDEMWLFVCTCRHRQHSLKMTTDHHWFIKYFVPTTSLPVSWLQSPLCLCLNGSQWSTPLAWMSAHCLLHVCNSYTGCFSGSGWQRCELMIVLVHSVTPLPVETHEQIMIWNVIALVVSSSCVTAVLLYKHVLAMVCFYTLHFSLRALLGSMNTIYGQVICNFILQYLCTVY